MLGLVRFVRSGLEAPVSSGFAFDHLKSVLGVTGQGFYRLFNGEARGYAPCQREIHLSFEETEDKFGYWPGSAAQADAMIAKYAATSGARGHSHRHWAFSPGSRDVGQAGADQPFFMLDDKGGVFFGGDCEVFRPGRKMVLIAPESAARVHFIIKPNKSIHGFFEDRGVVANLYRRILDPQFNLWLTQHPKFTRWINDRGSSALVVAGEFSRPVGVAFGKQAGPVGGNPALPCYGLRAVLRKSMCAGLMSGFYLSTSYVVPGRQEGVNPVV